MNYEEFLLLFAGRGDRLACERAMYDWYYHRKIPYGIDEEVIEQATGLWLTSMMIIQFSVSDELRKLMIGGSPMNKVWVVTHQLYAEEDAEVLVFSTKEKAEKYCSDNHFAPSGPTEAVIDGPSRSERWRIANE
jgi:hypothetical protein